MTDTGTQPPPPSDHARGVIPPEPSTTPASLEQQHTLATAIRLLDGEEWVEALRKAQSSANQAAR